MFYIKPMEVYESHKLRTYAFIGVTLFFTVFLMVLTFFLFFLGGIMALQIIVPIDCLILIPLGSLSFLSISNWWLTVQNELADAHRPDMCRELPGLHARSRSFDRPILQVCRV